MRIKQLHLENIGPFIEADLEFMSDEDEKPPVVLITGENGTGKSIILDAIREMFGGHSIKLSRDIRRRNAEQPSCIQAKLDFEDPHFRSRTNALIESVPNEKGYFSTLDRSEASVLFKEIENALQNGQHPNWVIDYWSSLAASDSYSIESLQKPNHTDSFFLSLNGEKHKSDVTQLICHFDYLRSSDDPQEKNTGEYLYKILSQIISYSLLDGGYFSHVARATYEPIVVQNNTSVGLSNLSSGNSYLIQSLIGLLGKMYSAHVLRKTALKDITHLKGLLLIDEAENQLHPKWQKRLISTILKLFPNLQIIATTHSPFIIASVENARLFVCKSKGDHCVVVDETAQYSNKPVDEILVSSLFDYTQPFNETITQLITRHKEAVEHGNKVERAKIETELKAINPTYFSYLDIDRLIDEIANGSNGKVAA